jgi:hypothetical protein
MDGRASPQVRPGWRIPTSSLPSPGMCRTRSMPTSIRRISFAALHAYLNATIADIAQNIPSGTLDRRYLDNLFRDLSADALCVIRNAAEEMREHENWRAS